MAFGKTLADKPTQSTDGTGTESNTDFEWQWMPIVGGNPRDKDVKGGTRKFRLLPELNLETWELVLDESGNMQTSTETRFLSVWYNVMLDGKRVPRRLILDWTRPFNNPYWNLVAKDTEKGSDERKAQKQMFALNVFDKSLVLFDGDGKPVYSDENNTFRIGANGKYVDTLTGKAQPLNKVRILEASAGDAGGKHFLQQLIETVTGLEDADGEQRQPYEAEILLKVSGIGVDVRRAPRATAMFNRPDDSIIFAPRYNLATWLQPWPDDAIKALINGADFNEVVEQFSIVQYPSLVSKEDTEESKADDSALFDD